MFPGECPFSDGCLVSITSVRLHLDFIICDQRKFVSLKLFRLYLQKKEIKNKKMKIKNKGWQDNMDFQSKCWSAFGVEPVMNGVWQSLSVFRWQSGPLAHLQEQNKVNGNREAIAKVKIRVASAALRRTSSFQRQDVDRGHGRKIHLPPTVELLSTAPLAALKMIWY